MSSRFLYLLLDFLAVSVPLAFSFHSKIKFYERWKFALPAILIPACLFIAWDNWFTGIGVWGFNTSYILGIYIFRLPLEEALFFICIPYACIFTYNALKYENKIRPSGVRYLSAAFAAILALIGLRYYNHLYTAVTFISLAILVFFLGGIRKAGFLEKFFIAYLIILFPFFIINGILTGTGPGEPVVWYNDAETLGLRIGTIPVEDIFYGMLLVLMNISVFEFLKKSSPPSP